MHTVERRRRPISTRHAFVLALDLALRRDPIQSVLVPLLLRAPWILALVLLPSVESHEVTPATLGLTSAALLGDFVTLLVVGAMLRVRARSVYNTPRETRPAPALECYARGVRRIPWLIVTEVLRNIVLAVAASLIVLPTTFVRFHPETALEDLARNLALLAVAALFVLPSLFVVYRLGVATEAVVLDEHDLGGAFQSSFRMMRGHLERWFELILASALVVLVPALLLAALPFAVPALAGTASLMLFWLIVVAAWPIVQYAWTFFYLRLVEIREPVSDMGHPELPGARSHEMPGLPARSGEPPVTGGTDTAV